MVDTPLHRLRRRAKSIGKRALHDLLSEDQRNEALGLAAKGVQEGRRLLDESSTKLLGALGLATQPDLERVTRKVGKLRKRLQSLQDRLEADGK